MNISTTVLEPISRFCAYFPDVNECMSLCLYIPLTPPPPPPSCLSIALGWAKEVKILNVPSGVDMLTRRGEGNEHSYRYQETQS